MIPPILFWALLTAFHLGGLVVFCGRYRGVRARFAGITGYAFLSASAMVRLGGLAAGLTPKDPLFVWLGNAEALLRLWGVFLVLAALFGLRPLADNEAARRQSLAMTLAVVAGALLFTVLGSAGEVRVSATRSILLPFPQLAFLASVVAFLGAAPAILVRFGLARWGWLAFLGLASIPLAGLMDIARIVAGLDIPLLSSVLALAGWGSLIGFFCGTASAPDLDRTLSPQERERRQAGLAYLVLGGLATAYVLYSTQNGGWVTQLQLRTLHIPFSPIALGFAALFMMWGLRLIVTAGLPRHVPSHAGDPTAGSEKVTGEGPKKEGAPGLLRVVCPKCHHRLRVQAAAAGKRIRCPNAACRATITVPTPPRPDPEPPEPPAPAGGEAG